MVQLIFIEANPLFPQFLNENVDEDVTSEINRSPRKQRFLTQWMEKSTFKDWLRPVPGNDMLFHCMACEKDFSCAAGMSNISQHALTANHIECCTLKGIVVFDDLTASSLDNTPTPFHRRKKSAEIRLAL